MATKHIEEITDWLTAQGATGVRIEHHSKHPKIFYTWQGKERFYVTSASSGDTFRGTSNAISDLRHGMGLVAPVKRVGDRRAHSIKLKSAILREIPVVTLKPAWQTSLQCHPLMSGGTDARLKTDRVQCAPDALDQADSPTGESPENLWASLRAAYETYPITNHATAAPPRQPESTLPPQGGDSNAGGLAPRAEPSLSINDQEEEEMVAQAALRQAEPKRKASTVRRHGPVPGKGPALPKIDEDELAACRRDLDKLVQKEQAIKMQVTPAMATAMLERNKANRGIKHNAVQRYASHMKDGHWLVTSETVGFSEVGVLVDGQNRLYGVLHARKPIETWVIFGCDKNAFKVMNSGEKRRLSDALTLMSEKATLNLAAVLRGLYCYFEEDYTFREPLDVFKGEDLLKAHPKIRVSMAVGINVNHSLRALPATPIAVCHYIFSKLDRDLADQFFERLRYGDGIKRTDPEYILRETFISEREAFKWRTKPSDAYAMIIRAWNARRKKYDITRHQLKNGTPREKAGEFPAVL